MFAPVIESGGLSAKRNTDISISRQGKHILKDKTFQVNENGNSKYANTVRKFNDVDPLLLGGSYL